MQTSAMMAQVGAVLVQLRELASQLAAQDCQLMLPATWEVLTNALLALHDLLTAGMATESHYWVALCKAALSSICVTQQ